MITSLHYYSYYKPRILKNDDETAVRQMPFKQSLLYTKSGSISLSTAYKENVLTYAKDLSDSINSTKSATHQTLTYLDDVLSDDNQSINKRNRRNNEKQNQINKVKGSLKKMVESLNKTVDFEKNLSSSDIFNNYSNDVLETVLNSSALSDLGISYDDNKYSLDDNELNKLKDDEIYQLFDEVYDDVKQILDHTGEFLSTPMSNHMSFKSFSYYYSYSAGIVKNESFNLISRGTLLDLQL